MMKKAAAAALKYAGKKMAANAAKKAKKGAERVAKAIAKKNPAKTAKRRRKAQQEEEEREALPNPYDQKGATFDLFGGESRALPKKVSEFHRPRLRIRGQTATFADGSPFKGRVARVNPSPRVVVQPLRVTLTAAEVKEYRAAPDLFLAALLAKAAQQSAAWDHIEARGPGGRHLFDVVP